MMSIEAPHLKQIEHNRRTPSVRRWSLYLGAAGVLLGLAIGLTWIKINVSPSTPLGLYRLHPVARPLTRGTLVIVHVPGWSARTVPFLKPVAAVAGEWVCRVGPTLVIHGEDYGPVHARWRGQSLPWSVGSETCVMVPPGHVFLASHAPQSLDSRYFGPVAITQLSAVATPLLTWSGPYAAAHAEP
jgi:type IV secretory pathway protease TraF